MTDEEINIKIAEALGRVRRPDGFWYPPGKTIGTAGIPNYCRDLNAMHEAEKFLLAGNAKQIIHATNRYTNELCRVLRCLYTALFQFAHATARQRAEAFLRTLDLWTE